MSFIAREVIKNKRDGLENSSEEIKELITRFSKDQLPDYQMAAWLMAVCIKGLNVAERSALTEVMLKSGFQFDFSYLSEFKVDKHSTGGVGDKTTMVLAPIVAASGLKVPMIAGRGLGHTGGTLDKLESIPGFQTRLSMDKFKKQIEEIGLAIMGQTEEICPADKRIYSMRDVTATIESVGLICGSIMSKKLAEGIDGLVLDVKYGNGAFMKSTEQAIELANALKETGEAQNCKVRAVISNMDQPLGQMIGNANEIEECISILKNTEESKSDYSDTRELSLKLAAEMISIGKKISSEDGYKEALSLLESGKAYEKFKLLIQAQGGELDKLPKATISKKILATQSGFVSHFETEKIGIAGILLQAGRKKIDDIIDPIAGIKVFKKLGDTIQKGECIFEISSSTDSYFIETENLLNKCYKVSDNKMNFPNLIYQTII